MPHFSLNVTNALPLMRFDCFSFCCNSQRSASTCFGEASQAIGITGLVGPDTRSGPNLALFWRVWACLDVHQIWRSCIGLENNSETASKSKTKLGTKWWCSFKSTARGLIHEQRWLTGCQPRAAILQGPLLQIARYESWASQEDCHCLHWEVVS